MSDSDAAEYAALGKSPLAGKPKPTGGSPMATMFIRHNVTDFARWKQAYDDFRPAQKRLGVTAEAVFRASDNPNDITITHEFASIGAAQEFAGSAELKTAMQNAGVAGAPTMWFASKA
jgi:hypothetical protein